MVYEVNVKIHNSPNRTIGWVYVIEADTKEEAIEEALGRAEARAMKPYSRFKKCTFSVDDKKVYEKPNW